MNNCKILLTPIDAVLVAAIKDRDPRLLAVWAADCAERVLPYFEAKAPTDSRPREALATCRQWAKTGIFHMSVIRGASLGAHAAARSVIDDDVARSAARAAGQAVATAHVPAHCLGASRYALTAIHYATHSAAAVTAEGEWEYQHLQDILSKA